MKLTILGSGDSAGVPVYGCECPACARARSDRSYRRASCSALVEADGEYLLLDAGPADLESHLPAGALRHILLTHYHMDHVQGLFRLRWGQGEPIEVISPDDELGADDLYKHPGILDFSRRARPFETIELAGFEVTPIPLNHSKPTLGYHIARGQAQLAYLTDTLGLPKAGREFLAERKLDLMVIDSSEPPRAELPHNHNDLDLALAIHTVVQPARTLLTHIGHRLDEYLMRHPDCLPDGISPAYDGIGVEL